jgi:nucleoside-diphosphate-sugar epimerase
MKSKISILGCGWLGLPLAESLVQKQYNVKGSTTSFEKLAVLENKKIEGYQITISDNKIEANQMASFLDSEVLVINFPPKRRADILLFYTQQFQLLIPEINKSNIKHVLFVSSTSVYPDTNGIVSETEKGTPDKDSGKALLVVEQLLMKQKKFSTTVVRFAGLIGYDRMPGRFLAGKKDVANGEAPINVIHQDDCVAVLETIIQKEIWGETFNACSDEHPKRSTYYTLAAEKIGLEKPTFIPSENLSYKIINSDKLKTKLEYQFKHPSPLDLLNEQ